MGLGLMKLKVFEPSDFEFVNDDLTPFGAADSANAKLNEWLKENGQVVYSLIPDKEDYNFRIIWGTKSVFINEPVTHWALLVNIQPLKTCTHPKEKVHWNSSRGNLEQIFKCECGAKLKPKEFEEIE